MLSQKERPMRRMIQKNCGRSILFSVLFLFVLLYTMLQQLLGLPDRFIWMKTW